MAFMESRSVPLNAISISLPLMASSMMPASTLFATSAASPSRRSIASAFRRRALACPPLWASSFVNLCGIDSHYAHAQAYPGFNPHRLNLP